MDYLKSPELVWEIQKWFGIKTYNPKERTNNQSDSDSMKNYYVIGNKFWHRLFMFGTALGDETFYSVFFPFWFWNIDGAVGRRVVFVWATVMYIGNKFYDYSN